MKTDPNDKAYPALDSRFGGLSKRELFAAMAMHGLLSGRYTDFAGNGDSPVPKSTADEAVFHAEALIAALNEDAK